MKGIRGRLVGSYLFIIIVTVFILELVLNIAINQYYYKNIENMLFNEIKVSVDFYNSYLSSSSLKKNIQDNTDIFWKNTSAEVQIIDPSGEMLMDSIGNYTPEKVQGEDIDKALKGDKGSTVIKDKKTGEKLLCVAYPLKSSDKIEGVLRFITSMKHVDEAIRKITFVLIVLGILVILFTGYVSIFLSNTIVKPIHEVIEMAEKIASGRFNERITKKREDEIGQLSDTLNFMADEIVKNDKLKNEFIASISHELRTPLTSIKGWASTVRTGDLEDKQEILDALEIIEKESDRLSNLVEELLDFSKFISGKVVLKKDYIDIKNTINYIKKQMSPKAARSNIKFNLEIEENIAIAFVDENRVKQVLINVLDNAFKFTEKNGQVILSAKQQPDNLMIIVKDTGMGIPMEDLDRVTEKFFKGKSSKSSNGIGLSICKEIVELHGGKLEIKSKLGVGTEVIIKLPIEL